jgi:uncharacterized protein YecE (DUF72 family)
VQTGIRIGASSWTAPSWEGVFYPAGSRAADWLPHYAARYDTVEVDATFYRIPEPRVVDGWRERTPAGFLFAAKAPQVITHEKVLEDCTAELAAFLRVMDRLGDRQGPILFQFRYFNKTELPDPKPFLDRLERFLTALPRDGRRYAVEVRNRNLVTDRLLDLLARNGVALALIDHPWFFRVDELLRRPAALTTDFAYVRWLGDRKGIEKRTTRWDRLIVDRTADLRRWIEHLRPLPARGRAVYGYFNNHYAGYAIGSIERFHELWAEGEAAGAPGQV